MIISPSGNFQRWKVSSASWIVPSAEPQRWILVIDPSDSSQRLYTSLEGLHRWSDLTHRWEPVIDTSCGGQRWIPAVISTALGGFQRILDNAQRWTPEMDTRDRSQRLYPTLEALQRSPDQASAGSQQWIPALSSSGSS